MLQFLFFLIFLYVVYVFLTAFVLFYLPFQKTCKEHCIYKASSISGDDQGINQVMLLDDGFESGQVRVQMIREAKKNIRLSYYSIQKGKTAEWVLGALMEAADRGVKVQLLLDGICHSLRGPLKHLRYAVANHPNMAIRFYEPFRLFKPWTWHNRLHDKLLLADGRVAVMGGRNIGDKYFADQPPKDFAYDRDVLLYNAKKGKVLDEMEQYFVYLWNHDFTKRTKDVFSKAKAKKGKKLRKQLLRSYQEAIRTKEPFVTSTYDWAKDAIRAKQIAFFTNPVERLNKRPLVLKKLNDLAQRSKRSVLIQTPYVIPTRPMKDGLTPLPNDIQTTIVTNSLTATPNPLAFAGYLSTKKELMKTGVHLYEYQGPYSIHAKSMVIDDNLSIIGTYNLDARSSFLNTESILVIDSAPFALSLTEAIELKIAYSVLVAKDRTEYKASDYGQKKKPFMKRLLLTGLSTITVLWRRLI
ncbi:phospholipase D-like domain-containing protein [Bacillus altitudinis]|uniref:phospholipase D-like domain-containing protein n=1 Tax=Bacillus altitudinis TaxID=293387 RepID=UPI0009AE52E6|nr:phospholipase D family protein [Bacillus altitudinis]OPW97629.1 phospholipase [Bacillus altitudinis]